MGRVRQYPAPEGWIQLPSPVAPEIKRRSDIFLDGEVFYRMATKGPDGEAMD